ncbi:GNAT family N-acetyltransferase [Geomicrobium sediminis]|uniref:Ribosomal protein S18 acetylase RimI-like enzyme n=1 Tax=Geomicrobium sediminis TaxID=1347788 RepID=A0ABS2PGL2_9BACL|nr:GNAT family N-acetyltransferase [Geomicrobium sediminis]MBM7634590.1 ribosomal protein S18 acetylase RimI-like enzyme [Geomicrobium sediminis]
MFIRRATLNDVEGLIDIRKKQLIDEGITADQGIDDQLRQFFMDKIESDDLIQWLAEEQGEIVATSAIVFYQFPPTYTNVSGVKGYITNIYTKPTHRGKGFGTKMLDLAVNEAKERGVHKLWLGASALGRSVYLRYGFEETDEWLELNVPK